MQRMHMKVRSTANVFQTQYHYLNSIQGLRTFSTAKKPHCLNINHAILKESEHRSFQSLSNDPTTTLQGIGPKTSSSLSSIGIGTIQELSAYKFYHLARAIATLAATEEEGKRASNSEMNLDIGLDKEFESSSLQDVLQLPVSALQGLSEKKGEFWKEIGVSTIQDLSQYKYCQWAESIVLVARYEVTKS